MASASSLALLKVDRRVERKAAEEGQCPLPPISARKSRGWQLRRDGRKAPGKMSWTSPKDSEGVSLVTPVTDLAILTEYEAGRAITAIEWVARGNKPIVEIGSRMLPDADAEHLATDLYHCIEISGESEVRGFAIHDAQGWWQFGFYRYDWAISAFLYLHNEEAPAIQGAHAHWVRGLLFGYNAESIQRFISSEFAEPTSIQTSLPCRNISRQCKVGIYDTRAPRVPLRSSPSGRYRTPD